MLLRRTPGAKPGAPRPEVAEAVAAAKRYFEGEETDFSGFRLDLGEQDSLLERIYAAARRIGWGRTTTYGALAQELGAGPEAARDVGQAMARNPVALFIPCHRVLAAGGKVGGFSALGGQETHARIGGRSRQANATGTAIFRILNSGDVARDSPLEEAVTSELVSATKFPVIQGKYREFHQFWPQVPEYDA